MLGAWQGSHVSTSFYVTGRTGPGKHHTGKTGLDLENTTQGRQDWTWKTSHREDRTGPGKHHTGKTGLDLENITQGRQDWTWKTSHREDRTGPGKHHTGKTGLDLENITQGIQGSIPVLPLSDRLVGQVVKAYALGAQDPGFESRLWQDFSGSIHTSDLKIGTPVATLPSAWCYRVSTGTGRPGVSILWLGEVKSWICNFFLSVAARKIVWADPSLRYTSMLLGCWATNQQTNCCSQIRHLTA